ncbi:hypothetical protein B0H15DRAFT_953406 [Mycena belliarum]|uniref:Uncharacterized protein n=1 Tax=Mycena belliarum TaxID=1033014 RepID=A0AAD6TV46_9AGAR|nr:hypothetical protein B0H15DRAFT_953394 [Mycena belliae]KAJ7080799.1 hypothetical protein B0H15DRAFT_953400 [Mycena belliae]KAJ7080804.1 hypothetical protein B0H15DRAFT_953406 [Mycena belliae]
MSHYTSRASVAQSREKSDALSIPLQRRRASIYMAFDALDALSDVPALVQLNLAPDLMHLTLPHTAPSPPTLFPFSVLPERAISDAPGLLVFTRRLPDASAFTGNDHLDPT